MRALHAPGVLDTAPRRFSEKERQPLRELAGWVEAEVVRQRELEQVTAFARARGRADDVTAVALRRDTTGPAAPHRLNGR